MERRKKRRNWVIALSVMLLAGVGMMVLLFNPKKGLKLVLPDLDDIVLINANIKNDTAYVGVNMVLENKSIFKLHIDTLFYKISLADSLLFNQTQVLAISQKPGEVDTLDLPFKIPVTKTMATIRSLQYQDSTYLDIHAYLVYNTIFGNKKIPVSKKVRIKVPVPPQIKVKHVEINKLSLANKTLDLTANIKIINKGELLDLNIHEVRYSISLGNNLITSEGVYTKPISIKPLGETDVSIPVTVKVNHLAKTAWKYLSNDAVDYHVEVNAKLDENSFYQKSDIPLEVKVSGKTKLRKN
jgi:LEA14-like dessication related protein